MAHHRTLRAKYIVGDLLAYDNDNTYFTRMICSFAKDVDWLFMARADVVMLQRKALKRNGLVQHLRRETGLASMADSQTFYWVTDVQGKEVEAAAIAIAAGDCQGGWPIRKLDTPTGKDGEVSETGVPDWASKVLEKEDIPLVAKMGNSKYPLVEGCIYGPADDFLDRFDWRTHDRKPKKMITKQWTTMIVVERRKWLNANVPV